MKGFKSLRSSLGSRFSKKAGDDGKVRGGEGVSAAGGATSGKENDSGEILDGNGGGGGGGGAERRGPYVFGCFDVNGKCGLPQWRRRKEELQSLDDEALQEEALELLGGGAPPPGAGEGRDGLTSALMAMEELGEVTFDTSPRLTELRGALKEAVGGGESNFDFSYHVPAAYPAKEGEERYVRDDAALKECLATVRESGMLPLAIELHPRSCLVHLDCFDAEADEDDVYLARITVPDDAPWEDLEGALRHEFRGGMRDGCLVYWVRQGRRGFPNGSVAFVDAEGRGWEELRSACLRDAGRRAEVDIKVRVALFRLSCPPCASRGPRKVYSPPPSSVHRFHTSYN